MTKKVINKIIKDGQVYYIFGSGGADIDVDSALSTTSENPVQNKVITTELNKKANSNSLGTAASKDTGTSAGNVPLLNSNGKLDDSIIPAVAIVDTYAVTNKSDLLALSAQKGDVGIVSSESKSYILGGTGDPTVEANWLWLKTPSAVNDATISLTQAGESIDSFTVNQATNKTIALRGDIFLTQDEYDALPGSKLTDGNNYHIIDASGTSKRLYSVGATAPENPTQGDLWYDTTEDVFKSYDGSDWNEIGGGGGVKYANIDLLIVGGGGGGGTPNTSYCQGGGGGGAGGYIYKSGLVINNGTEQYAVGVGAGGGANTNGGNSYFGSCIAYGGGAGGTSSSCTCGKNGGSGGGGGGQCSWGGYCGCALGCAGQGHNGGRPKNAGSGGGGAGSDGCNSIDTGNGGNGGVGCQNDISGECVWYSGGGGGGASSGNLGYGCSGGGNGGKNSAGCPATTYGSGGGGGGKSSGGCGCQGVVYIRYKTDGSCGLKPMSYGGCKYTCGDYTIHRFTDTTAADTFIPVFK